MVEETPRDGDAIPGQRPSSVAEVERLIVKHQRQIRGIISRRSGPQVLRRTTVNDLYQETVARAIASAATFVYDGDARFLAWMGTIVRRVVGRALNQQDNKIHTVRIKRTQSTGVGVTDAELPSTCRSPSSVAAGLERSDRLARALRNLPEHYREVIRLYKLEQLPLREVAARLGRTPGATCQLLQRALQQLREVLTEP